MPFGRFSVHFSAASKWSLPKLDDSKAPFRNTRELLKDDNLEKAGGKYGDSTGNLFLAVTVGISSYYGIWPWPHTGVVRIITLTFSGLTLVTWRLIDSEYFLAYSPNPWNLQLTLRWIKSVSDDAGSPVEGQGVIVLASGEEDLELSWMEYHHR